jgi:hypothetical protein
VRVPNLFRPSIHWSFSRFNASRPVPQHGDQQSVDVSTIGPCLLTDSNIDTYLFVIEIIKVSVTETTRNSGRRKGVWYRIWISESINHWYRNLKFLHYRKAALSGTCKLLSQWMAFTQHGRWILRNLMSSLFIHIMPIASWNQTANSGSGKINQLTCYHQVVQVYRQIVLEFEYCSWVIWVLPGVYNEQYSAEVFV